MNPSDITTTTHLLKPKWSRLLHRMHTLGKIQHRYHNAIASVTAQGEYPRLLTTPREDRSTVINGNNELLFEWLFENWKQVTVRVAAEFHQADFLFTSESNELFHEISLTAESQWDCFECMLKLFKDENTHAASPPTILTPTPETTSAYNKINTSITQVAKAVNREIIRGKKVICSIPLAGSSMLKELEFKSLMTQFGTAALKKQHSKLTINPQAVSHHKITQSPSKFLTTLFDATNKPLLHIQTA